MNVSTRNIERIRRWLDELMYVYKNQAESTENKLVQEFYLKEASKIMDFLDQNLQ